MKLVHTLTSTWTTVQDTVEATGAQRQQVRTRDYRSECEAKCEELVRTQLCGDTLSAAGIALPLHCAALYCVVIAPHSPVLCSTTTLHCTALLLHWLALQCTALPLHWLALRCHATTMHCFVLRCQYTALRCHCTDRHCTALTGTALTGTALLWPELHCFDRHCVATAPHCRVLRCHCTAMHCFVLRCHCTELRCHCTAQRCHWTAFGRKFSIAYTTNKLRQPTQRKPKKYLEIEFKVIAREY